MLGEPVPDQSAPSVSHGKQRPARRGCRAAAVVLQAQSSTRRSVRLCISSFGKASPATVWITTYSPFDTSINVHPTMTVEDLTSAARSEYDRCIEKNRVRAAHCLVLISFDDIIYLNLHKWLRQHNGLSFYRRLRMHLRANRCDYGHASCV